MTVTDLAVIGSKKGIFLDRVKKQLNMETGVEKQNLSPPVTFAAQT